MTRQIIFLIICVLTVLHHVLSRRGCCGPQQWTGVAIQKLGRYDHDVDVASLADVTTHVAYSYDDRKVSLQQEVYNMTVKSKNKVHVIYEFKEGIEYIITNDNYCISYSIGGEMWSGCVPDNAIHLGTYNISGPTVDIYRVVSPSGATIRFSVSSQLCYPATESLLTQGPVYDLKVSVYENVTKGISDPSVFKVPVFCHHSQIKKKYISSTITELIHSSFSWG
ncbi:uncharacterized protein LOC133183702 [Saccostrea echinata]|uniref:uncharacterized protein LOC133183702 n=1 Tax=Saccostrea echinata TaxID=191078 RepID=UPI002A832EE8|nr:uncharacterized protein LOC133183702 [Saccostrea echinata]